jgi:hypothetical protein
LVLFPYFNGKQIILMMSIEASFYAGKFVNKKIVEGKDWLNDKE